MNPLLTLLRGNHSPTVSLDGFYFPAGPHDRLMGLTDEFADIVATVEEPDGPYLLGSELVLTPDELQRAERLLLDARQKEQNEHRSEQAIER